MKGGPSAGGNIGPVKFEAGADGAVRGRVQAARGWTFPDRATAKRFLEHSVKNAFDDERWPWTWQSGELAREVSAQADISAGAEDVAGGDIVAVSVVRPGRDRDAQGPRRHLARPTPASP